MSFICSQKGWNIILLVKRIGVLSTIALKLRGYMHYLYLFFLINIISLHSADIKRIYSKIKDICHPTLEDYLTIQNFFLKGDIPYLNRLDSWQYRDKYRNFCFVTKSMDYTPYCQIIPVNCDENHIEDCILLYASMNYNYPNAVRKMIEKIQNTDFKGHILCRIGGWPDVEGGGLLLAHIPYAFKICFFREAQRLGYKKALWLDASVNPLVSLEKIFHSIQERSIYTFKTPYNVQELCNLTACAAMEISFEEAKTIPACLAGIIGFNLENIFARKVLNQWYDYTKNREEASFSPRQELCVISVVLYQLGFTDMIDMNEKVTWIRNEIYKKDMEFFVDKNSVQPDSWME